MKTFVLAITTYNRVDYLKDCITSWVNTRSNNNINWTLLIADDGSTDGTLEYLSDLQQQYDSLKLIENSRIGVNQQTNEIIKELSTMEFDLCFMADDDIQFIKEGWDVAYDNAIQETGYDHLIFYDKKWNTDNNREVYTTDFLENNTSILTVQGCFYTITPNVIKSIGYFDVLKYEHMGPAHTNYSQRACNEGYNDVNRPFDILDSNKYISICKDIYVRSTPLFSDISFTKTNLQDTKNSYIPYKTLDTQLENFEPLRSININGKLWKFATLSKNPNPSIESEIGRLFKRLYNWNLERERTLIPDLLKYKFSNLPFIGRHFNNIDL